MKERLGMTSNQIFVGALVVLAIVIGILAVARLDTTGEKGSGLGREYIYDVGDLAKIDPNLILYEESTEPINTGFGSSRGIAVDGQGVVYVAGDKSLRLFAQEGDLLDEIRLNDMPRCLAVAEDGKIYVAMLDHVEVLDDRRTPPATWQSLGEDAVLTSIAVYKNDVFVADAGNRIVLHFDVTGKLINRIGKRDKDRNIPGFVVPSPYFDVAVARDGLLRVTDPGRHRIEAYTFGGDLEFWWGDFSTSVEGFCGCCNPVNFAILEDESFVTCEKGLTRVKIYDPDGTFIGVVAGPEQLVQGGTSRICTLPSECQTGGFDVAVGPKDRIFVLDTIKNVVRTFTKIKAAP